jgi:hypothetical protein
LIKVFNKKYYKNFYLKIIDIFLTNYKNLLNFNLNKYTINITSNKIYLRKNIKNFIIFFLLFNKIYFSINLLPKTKKFLFLYKPSKFLINYY